MKAFMSPQGLYRNIFIDGDEFTSGFLGLHWFPSAGASANQQHYENDVESTLTRLSATMTGWAVLTEVVSAAPRTMTIQPYHPDPANGTFNATARATNLADATMKDTTALGPTGKLPNPGESRTIGTGAGSNSIINFSPGTWTSGSGAPAGPGATGDEILLHEMVHGLRQMQGRSVREAITGNPGMDNYEEFVAILIANIYRSEKGIAPLRRDHYGFIPLIGPTTNTATFKSTYAQWLGYMDIEQPRLCQNLRMGVTATFNPLI